MKIRFILLSLICTSCQMYQSTFDCPPSRGVPCAAGSEIERRIIETEKGPDLIAGVENPHWSSRLPVCAPAMAYKVWIPESQLPGCKVESHYIYIGEVDDECPR